jgi:hypothetical protein
MIMILILDKGPLGFGSFATTLMTLSLSMMGVGAVSNQAVFIANLCLLAGIGLFISAIWKMLRGNTFAYTVLAAFGNSLLPCRGSANSIVVADRSQSFLLRWLWRAVDALGGHRGLVRR